MSIQQFPSTLYFRVSETAETFVGAGFTPGAHQQLNHAIVMLYSNGAPVKTERFRMKLFHDAAMSKPYATGDWLSLRSIPNISASWLGRVRFDFSSMPWLNAAFTYYLAIEADGYTRNGDSRYCGWKLNWPFTVNAGGISNALHLELYGTRSKSI